MIALTLRLEALASLAESPPRSENDLNAASLDSALIEHRSLDEIAAEHYAWFTHELMPAASAFLDEEGLLGGSVSQRMRRWMAEAGYEPDLRSVSPDHLAVELRLIAHMLQTDQVKALFSLLRMHTMGWVPLLTHALSTQGPDLVSAFGMAVASTLKEVVQITSGVDGSDQAPEFPFELAPAGFDLDDPRVSLAEIGRFLAVPARSGLVLTHAFVAKAARESHLPTGFGTRSRQIEGWLRSAGQYDGLLAVGEVLSGAIDDVDQMWTLEEKGAGTSWAQQWRTRLGLTRSIVDSIQSVGLNETPIHPDAPTS